MLENQITKKLNTLRNFEFINPLSTQIYFDAIKFFLLQLDLFIYQHTGEFLQSAKNRGFLFKWNFENKKANTCQTLFYDACFTDLRQNCKTLSLFTLYQVIDTIFLDLDLLFSFKTRFQNPEIFDETNKALVKFLDSIDPIFNSFEFTENSRFKVKEFISSYIRIQPCNLINFDGSSINTDLKKQQLLEKPENPCVDLKNLLKNTYNRRHCDNFLISYEDRSKEIVTYIELTSNVPEKLCFFNQYYNQLIIVDRPDEDDDCFDDYCEMMYELGDPFDPDAFPGLSKQITVKNLEKATLKTIKVNKSKDPNQKLYNNCILNNKIDIELKAEYYNIFNFDEKMLPFLIQPGSLVVLETNTLLNVDLLLKRKLCCISSPKLFGQKEIFGPSILYIFADFNRYNKKNVLSVLNLTEIFNSNEYEGVYNYEQCYKKVNGKYVKMNRSLLLDMMGYFQNRATQMPDEEYETKVDLFESLGYGKEDIASLEKIIYDLKTSSDLDLLLNYIKNSSLEVKEKKYIKALITTHNDLLDFRKYTVQVLKNEAARQSKEWAELDTYQENIFLDIQSELKEALTSIDYTDLMKTFHSEDLKCNLNSTLEKMKELGELPKRTHQGKTGFNLFGYSTDLCHELDSLLGSDINNLNKKIRVNKSTHDSLNAFLINIRSTLDKLHHHKESESYNNDYHLYVFFKNVFLKMEIDDTMENSKLWFSLWELSNQYTIDRNELLSKHNNKRLPRPKKDSRLTSRLVSDFLNTVT